jgi:Uma2 family endonuclease
MSQILHSSPRKNRESEPAWEIARLFPTQGNWDEVDYLELDGNYLVELNNGSIEVLPMPTTTHQFIMLYLYGLLLSFVSRRGLGTVVVAPLRIHLGPKKFREPDVVFMLRKHAHRIGEQYWEGADLVMEVVSGGEEDRRRDLFEKRRDYARAGIPEYWIVDPQEERIIVLRLSGKRYLSEGSFSIGQTASSILLPGFSVDVKEVFAKRLAKNGGSRPKRKS